jgi:hypothetical protein
VLPRHCVLAMSQTCQNCGQSFEVTKGDLEFYEKVSPTIGSTTFQVPPPTHCPDCRQQRRFTFRNERHLYHRKCDLTGKTMISNFHPDSSIKAYGLDEWWSDTWDAKQYGRDLDFSRPFFEQFAQLQKDVPQLGLSVWNCENCNFCNYVGDDKNCYLIFGAVYSEDCYYGSPYYSKDCIDTLVVRECERCYECVDCRKLYECFYCQDCHSSSNLISCYDCQGCSECIACAGLRNKKFCIGNEELSEEEYKEKKAQIDLCNSKTREALSAKCTELALRIPHRYMQSNQVENVSGNYVYQCKNVHNSFYADRSEDCRYCAQVVDLKDCYDNNYTEENELCCDYLGAYQNTRTSFSKFCNQVHEALYCDACHMSKNLFGCIGMQNSEYCVLNKEYRKEEYEGLVTQILQHMQKSGEWGEFFPVSISPFGYNETVAQEFFPLQKKDVEAKRWFWREEDRQQDKYMGPEVTIPDNIDDVEESICEQILLCESSGKPYKLIPQELSLYRDLHLPVPHVTPNERHLRRLALRNPRKLWDRQCAKCQKDIRTSYSPDRPETIYCEQCYLASVY